MKKSLLIFCLFAFYSITSFSQDQGREYYQLKIYSFDSDEQIAVTDSYLKDAYLPALKRQGINNIGVFKLRPTDSITVKKIFVLIPFSSLAQFETLEDELDKDETYLATGNTYVKASHKQPPYQRIASVVLKAFDDMPHMQASILTSPREDRIYELRSYESPTESYYKNKVEMFNEGGEVKLFDRLDFNAVFYAEVLSGAQMPNLMYMTTFANQTSRDAHWKAFVEAPEWKELIGNPKYENNVSHAEITFLYPTDYSDY